MPMIGLIISRVRKKFKLSNVDVHLLKYIFTWIVVSFLATIFSYYGVIFVYSILK